MPRLSRVGHLDFCHYFVIIMNSAAGTIFRQMAFVFLLDCCCCLLDYPKQTCPSKNRSSWILLMYLDGFVLDRDLNILLPTLIALTGFLLYLRGGHAPCCRGPFVASQSLRSHRAPTGLGSHQTTGSLWSKICDDSPLCLCLGQSLFEDTFLLVCLAAHHSSFTHLLWEALLHQAGWMSFLWADTVYQPIPQSQGFSDGR